MADPYVRQTGQVEDLDGTPLAVGVDYDTVAIYAGGWLSADGVRLTSSQAEEFAQLFVAACWEAARNVTRLADELCPADCGGGQHDEACRGTA